MEDLKNLAHLLYELVQGSDWTEPVTACLRLNHYLDSYLANKPLVLVVEFKSTDSKSLLAKRQGIYRTKVLNTSLELENGSLQTVLLHLSLKSVINERRQIVDLVQAFWSADNEVPNAYFSLQTQPTPLWAMRDFSLIGHPTDINIFHAEDTYIIEEAMIYVADK